MLALEYKDNDSHHLQYRLHMIIGSQNSLRRPSDCLLQIGIVEHNGRTLSTQLESYVLQICFRRGFQNLAAHNGATCERNLANSRVLAYCLSNLVT